MTHEDMSHYSNFIDSLAKGYFNSHIDMYMSKNKIFFTEVKYCIKNAIKLEEHLKIIRLDGPTFSTNNNLCIFNTDVYSFNTNIEMRRYYY
jgi:hypothetical protein